MYFTMLYVPALIRLWDHQGVSGRGTRPRDGQAERPRCKRIRTERGKSMLTGKLGLGADGALVLIKAYQTNVGYDLHSELYVRH